MTAVDVDALDKLAYVLHEQGYCGEVCVCVDDARALLPVVDRIANERAAAELESRAQMVSARAAAEERDSTGDAAEVLDEVSAWLTARAAALRASNGDGTGT